MAASRYSRTPSMSLVGFVVAFWCVAKVYGLANASCGLDSGRCEEQCRQLTCQALKGFYETTYKHGPLHKSWAIRTGWEGATGRTCSEILQLPTSTLPEYCSWHGVLCCSNASIRARRCTVEGSVLGLDIPVNGLTGDISSPEFMQAITQLHTCGLILIKLDGNALFGNFTDDWGKLTDLIVFSMARNHLTGTIPHTIRNMRKLFTLSLDGNPMHGNLPEWLGELAELRFLTLGAMTYVNPDGSAGLTGTIPASLANLTNLVVLELGVNSLTGAIPGGLCHSTIDAFSWPSNRLTANLHDLLNCKSATRIDLSYNKITGTLPDVPRWDMNALSWLALNDNDIHGAIPKALYQVQSLAFVNFKNNRLSGTIDRTVGQARALSVLMLQDNQLTGSIHESFWTLRRVNILDLHNNQLTGTIGSEIGGLAQLSTINLANNKLAGPIPSEMGYLSALVSADFRNNSFSSSGGITTSRGNQSGKAAVDGTESLLPCFLTLSDFTMPLSDSSNMACPVLYRKAREDALQDCKDQTQQQASRLPDLGYAAQSWNLDPSYYKYSGCHCLEGYDAIWQLDTLTCRPTANKLLPDWVVPIAVVLSVVGCMLLAAAALLVWFRMAVQLRMKWQREQETKRHKQLGIPSSGLATIVVTDIEQYSGLTQWNGPVAAEALAIHNAVLRKATATHAGHVIEQEGDSWSVAFHSPMEAVAFCLQVQQALHRSSWPQEVKTFYATVCQVPDGSCDVRAGDYISSAGGLLHRSSFFDNTTRDSTSAGSLQMLRLIGSMLWPAQKHVEQSGPAGVAPRYASSESMAAGGSVIMKRASVLGPQAKGGAFRGLRVRMGVASGTIVPEGAITRSTLFKLAKVVCDMANGGQVLLEAVTFNAVRDRLTELGQVDHNGYNDSLHGTACAHARDSRRSWWVRCQLARLLTSKNSRNTDAIMLDMGQYWLPDIMVSVQARGDNLETIDEGVLGAADGAGANWIFSSVDILPSDGISAPLGRAAVAVVHCTKRRPAYKSLFLYSVHAQPLCARAKAWTNKLNLPSAVQRVAKGYHEAPGALRADLVPTKYLEIDRQPLPPVTVVFVAVIDADHLVHQKTGIAEAVHVALASVMQALLLCMKDGYMCRQQEGVLKYMVAFKEPTKAAEWCIMLQALMQQLPWPSEVLTAKARRSATLMQRITRSASEEGHMSRNADSPKGRWRPSLKIGFDEGQPNLIYPDHLGHADYFGSKVNLAARMMGIAGSEEIVLSSELAQKIFDTWRYEAEVEVPSTATGNTQSSTFTCSQDPELSAARMAAVLPNLGLPDSSASPVSSSPGEACNLGDAKVMVSMPCDTVTAAKITTAGSLQSSHVAHVSAHHIGTYAFKGCGEVDMVCLTSSIQLGSPPQLRVAVKEAKGTLVTSNSGPVIGLQDCPVMLPDVLPAFERAWKLAARHSGTRQ